VWYKLPVAQSELLHPTYKAARWRQQDNKAQLKDLVTMLIPGSQCGAGALAAAGQLD
jgi:hypothetical protein